MSSPVVTVSTRETLWEAWGLLYRSGLRHLVVLDGTRCIGVLDDRRVVAECPLGPATPHRRTVGEAMSRQCRVVVPATAISVVARIMLDERTDAVPVVTDRGDILGLITTTDIVNLVACGNPNGLQTLEKP
jgi:acetoin utilization protein AcuB